MPEQLAGRILTPEGFVRGRLTFAERILGVEPDPAVADEPLILPGFVDLHVHGGGGAEVMQGEAGIRQMAAFHLRHGTTALLATTVTAPAQDLLKVAEAVAAVVTRPGPNEARVVGLHLEGPFISPQALGAQPPFAIPLDLPLLERILATGVLRVVTLAPEIDPDLRLIRRLAAAGVRPQIGHTRCTWAEAVAALAAGATGFTHLFNAMSGLAHRAPGAAAAAFALSEWAEIIPDLQHVAPGAILAARRAIPGLYGITDAVRRQRAAGLYRDDREREFRRSHENPYVQTLYSSYLGKPLSDKAHRLLHNSYKPRPTYRR
jgi:N-acetylglucosamine-6-phosphate deacetylase